MIMNLKQRETKFKLRIKLNYNRYIVKERYFSYHAAIICELSTARSTARVLSTQSTVSLSQLICSSFERTFVIVIYVSTLPLALIRWSIVTTGLCLCWISTRQCNHFMLQLVSGRLDSMMTSRRRDKILEKLKGERRWRASRQPEDLAAFKVKRKYAIQGQA